MCMANTEPVNDNASITSYILDKAAEAGFARVYPVGCLSEGMRGEKLSQMGELAAAGCVAVSDDGLPVTNGDLMRRAIAYSDHFGLLVIDHAEDLAIAGDGVMREGSVSTRLGLEGIPSSSEASAVARDIALLREFGGRLHLAHISTSGSLALVRAAKADGLELTAETCPHYFTLTEDDVARYDTNAKMRPPLGSAEDLEAVKEALADGTIDVIATDHAPHHQDEKDLEFDLAAFGVSGLETAMGLTLKLVDDGLLNLPEAVAKWTCNPARIAGLEGGGIVQTGPADLTLVDLAREWTVDPEKFASMGKNTPFAGMELKGQVLYTMVGGKMVFRLEEDA